MLYTVIKLNLFGLCAIILYAEITVVCVCILIYCTTCGDWYIGIVRMGGATLSPLRPGPHQILNKITSGPHQKMTSVLGLTNEWLPLIGILCID